MITFGLNRKLRSPLTHHFLHKRPPHLAQHAIRDKIIKVLGDLHLFTLINRIAEFCQLTNDVFALRALCYLMLCCEVNPIQFEATLNSTQ